VFLKVYRALPYTGIPEGGEVGGEVEEGAEQLGPPYRLLGAEESLYCSVRRPDGTVEDDPYARYSTFVTTSNNQSIFIFFLQAVYIFLYSSYYLPSILKALLYCKNNCNCSI
jgi:hypothetical protein